MTPNLHIYDSDSGVVSIDHGLKAFRLYGKKIEAPFLVLAIETSCDDTAVAIMLSNGVILFTEIVSQANIHEKFGGVHPMDAAEGHEKALSTVVTRAFESIPENIKHLLKAVAVTVGPGLSKCLRVGVEFAIKLAREKSLFLFRVHHVEAHLLISRLPSSEIGGIHINKPTESDFLVKQYSKPTFPIFSLLISGGHNITVLSTSLGEHKIMGSTLDDSVGDAFDKCARLIGINSVPGGPVLEKFAKLGTSGKYKIVEPLSQSSSKEVRTGADYSFAGLKTSWKRLVEKLQEDSKQSSPKKRILTESVNTKLIKVTNESKILDNIDEKDIDHSDNFAENNLDNIINHDKQNAKENNINIKNSPNSEHCIKNDDILTNVIKKNEITDNYEEEIINNTTLTSEELLEKLLAISPTFTIPEYLEPKEVVDLARCMQDSMIHHLCRRTLVSFRRAEEITKLNSFIVGGGVAANQAVRTAINNIIKENSNNLLTVYPHPKLCTDNAIMIGWTALEMNDASLGVIIPEEHGPESYVHIKPRWDIGELEERVSSRRSRQPKISRQPFRPADLPPL